MERVSSLSRRQAEAVELYRLGLSLEEMARVMLLIPKKDKGLPDSVEWRISKGVEAVKRLLTGEVQEKAIEQGQFNEGGYFIGDYVPVKEAVRCPQCGKMITLVPCVSCTLQEAQVRKEEYRQKKLAAQSS